MKRFVAVLLTLILLCHALPMNALASVGRVLTENELAAAYALTGFGDGGARSNSAFHKGMKPNETWNAMQVSDWLEEILDTYMFSVEDVLTRASIKLVDLREKDPKAYERFTTGAEYAGTVERMQKMYREAEALREELRYQKECIEEQASLIAEFGRQLKEEGGSIYASDRVRYSAKIEAATAELKAIRKEVADKAAQWESELQAMLKILNTEQHGGESEDPAIGGYLEALYAYGDGYIENTATVNVVGSSSSRMGRLSANKSVLSNDASSTVHVMTENEICIQLYTGQLKDGKFIKDVKVTAYDLNNKETKIVKGTTDEKGQVFFQTNQFVVDDDKNVHLKLDVDAKGQGYRDFGIEHAVFKLGETRNEPLTKLNDQPYIYSASFKDHDILRGDFEMLYSDLNNLEFEIKAVVRTPDSSYPPKPMFSYWEDMGYVDGYEQRWVEPDAHLDGGDTYVFHGQWKRKLTPFIAKNEKPFFAFSKEASAERTPARIKSIKGAVDAPVDKGGGIFNKVLGDGFALKFKIPGVNVDAEFELPIKKFLPKISIDLGGFVTIFAGSELFEEQLKKSKLNWKNQELKELKEVQKDNEKKGFLANYQAQNDIAFQYYTERSVTFLMESKIKFGLFGLVSGRWQIDKQDQDVKLTVVKVRGCVGVTLAYSFSWQMRFTIGVVPFYIAFSLGLSAGVGLGLQIGFSWADGSFHDWQLQLLKEIIVNLGFSFSAQGGMGVKGLLDLWLKFSAGLNFRLRLMLMGDGRSTISGSYSLSLSAGFTMFLLSASKDFWSSAGPLFDEIPLSNALPPLQQYAAQNAAAPEEITPAGQEPSSYAQLAPAAKAILKNEADARSAIRVGTSDGHTYAFYLDRVDGRQRVCWVDVKTGMKGSAQDFLTNEYTRGSRESDDYAFDVWSDGRAVIVVACCADRFDDDGYPAASSLLDGHAYAWILPLGYNEYTGGLGAFGDQFFARERSACNLDAALNPRGITNPRIEWAKVTYEGAHEEYAAAVEVYGFAERVDDGSGGKGYACFEYTGGRNFHLMSDMAVKNALGDDHQRINLRSSVRGHSGAIDAVNRFRCFGFVALSQPKEGVAGESAIELYDWEMNTAPVTFTTQTKPEVKLTLTDTKRRAVAVRKGDIGSFEMVQTVRAGSDAYAQTLFYTEADTDGDGAKQYKLKGLRIDNKKGALSRSLSYDVTDLAFDITMPAADFEVQTVHGTPYIYWLSTATREKERDSDPDTWRLWVSVYDPATSTASAPAVFSEFTLESGLVPHDVLLTTDGQGYLTVTPMPKEGDKKTPPMTLYSFPLTLKPVLTASAMILNDTTAAAGDFKDATIALMNEGNMGISAFDLELYTRENGKVSVVETLHCDCLRPENNSLTMQGGGQSATLRKGKQAIYRNDDFDYTTRQRDWVLGEKTLTLKASQSGKSEAWKSSLSERDSKSRYVKSNMLMPGALASFTGTLKIPENWSGDKTLYLRVANISTYANWQGAMANAAGVKANSSIAANAAATRELTWTLDEDGDKLVLQAGELASNAAFANAVSAGLIANAVNAGKPLALETAYHDIEISHRVYADGDGSDLLDIIISNYADTDDRFRLSCQVYLDGEDTPLSVSLPYYQKALASRATHTITLPVSALVVDPDAHSSAWVSISAIGRDENAYANNEFLVYLDGSALHFIRQPEDETVQEGEDVSFEVEVGGGVKPYSYQWQIWDEKHQKWVDIPGFTGPTLSRKDIEKKWDGCKFRCVVTDAAGTQIISRVVTLTVRDRVPTGDDSNLPLYLAVALAALIALIAIRRRYRGA